MRRFKNESTMRDNKRKKQRQRDRGTAKALKQKHNKLRHKGIEIVGQ